MKLPPTDLHGRVAWLHAFVKFCMIDCDDDVQDQSDPIVCSDLIVCEPASGHDGRSIGFKVTDIAALCERKQEPPRKAMHVCEQDFFTWQCWI